MIQGKEIRIGNYLKDRNGNVLRVDFIEHLENGFSTKFGQKNVLGEEDLPITEYSDYAEPIELTEEWLQKFGFEKTDDYVDIIYYEPKNRRKRRFYICFDYDINVISFGLALFDSYIPLSNLQYVHQFQNIYYTLTNVELSL